MANKTLYVREVDLPLWDQAKAKFGERGVSSMFAAFLRESLSVREGFLHVLWADDGNNFQRGRFAVMFAPNDSEGPMKPRYCQGVQELSRFLEKLDVTSERLEIILGSVKQKRSAAERLSLRQAVIQLFDPRAERVEAILLNAIANSHIGPGLLKGHQDHWGGWMRVVTATEAECTPADLLSAFKRLRSQRIVRLSKPDQVQFRYEGMEYSGNDKDDDAFFFTGVFNAVLTEAETSELNTDRI